MATPTRKKAPPKRKKDARSASVAEKRPDFEHRPVDHAGKTAPAGSTTTLSDKERQLLGDLFAVIEEHADHAARNVDREMVERAFLFS